MVTHTEVLQQLAALRARQNPPRGVEDSALTLPQDSIDLLIAHSRGPQAVAATVEDTKAALKRPGAMGTFGIGPVHKVTFAIPAPPAADIRYVRLVRAVRLEQHMVAPPRSLSEDDHDVLARNDPHPPVPGTGVKLSHTLPGYVTYSKPVPHVGGRWEAAVKGDSAGIAACVEAVHEEWASARWSYDGPAKEWSVEGQPTNIDQPGVARDPEAYPLAFRLEFIGVLFRTQAAAEGAALLNVRHYEDSFLVTKGAVLTVPLPA